MNFLICSFIFGHYFFNMLDLWIGGYEIVLHWKIKTLGLKLKSIRTFIIALLLLLLFFFFQNLLSCIRRNKSFYCSTARIFLKINYKPILQYSQKAIATILYMHCNKNQLDHIFSMQLDIWIERMKIKRLYFFFLCLTLREKKTYMKHLRYESWCN